MLVYVGVCGFEERGGRLHRCVRRFDRPIALQAGDCQLGVGLSRHSTTLQRFIWSEFIRSEANVEGAGVRRRAAT